MCGEERDDVKEHSTHKQNNCHEKHEEIISPSQATEVAGVLGAPGADCLMWNLSAPECLSITAHLC